MDTEKPHGVNLRNAVYVEGITSHDTDEQILEFCSTYGTVNKILRVRQTGQENGVKALVEFESEESVTKIMSDSAEYFSSPGNPDVLWHVAKAYKVTSTPQKLPKHTEHLELSDHTSSGSEAESDDSRTPLVPRKRTTSHSTRLDPLNYVTDSLSYPKSTSAQATQRVLSDDIVNPPDVQRIIVEHVIKNDKSDASNLGSKRLRPFSGKLPKPANEADFQTWSLHVELMVQDKTPLDIQRRKILESLLPPASDLIRQLGPHSAPSDYVKLLESAYGLVEDGEEIFARFLSTHQNAGERASEYLQRLQVLITTAIKRGGIAKADANKQLLRQFRRGCWDQSLILALQLGLKSETPPDFSDFLLEVRTEEDRRMAKQDRMHRHLGNTTQHKSRSMNMQLVEATAPSHDPSPDVLQTYINETEALRKQVAELKMQLTNKREQRKQKHAKKTHQIPVTGTPSVSAVAEVRSQQALPKPMPKAWFCFKCGNDGHLARQCENPPNKPLVDQKYRELKTKQDQWQTQYGHLNWTGLP